MAWRLKKQLLALLGGLALAGPALARADEAEPAPVVTRQQIHIDGKLLNYTAETGRIAIRDVQTGQPRAYMFYTAYRVASTGKPRPLTFLWGGGPGGDSLGMDVTYVGPRLTGAVDGGDVAGHPGRMIDNPNTLLPETDLVFIDEIGTGYSRATSRDYVQEFNSTIGDTDSFAEFIRAWRIQHDAQAQPVLMGGVSWGAPRAATVSYALLKQGVPVAGAVLVSGETSINTHHISPELFDALRIVGMSEIALRWHKLSPDLGEDLARIQAEADRWAREVYAPALARKASLTDAEREQVVQGLARYTGLSPHVIDRRSLRISPALFRRELLRSEDRTLYGSDLRLTEFHRADYFATGIAYLRHELGYRTDLPYLSLGRAHEGYAPFRRFPDDIFETWNFATSPTDPDEIKALTAEAAEWGAGPPTIGKPLPATEEAIGLNPKIRYLIVIDRYDGEQTCASDAALYEALPAQVKQAITLKCYPAGHSFIRTPGMAELFRKDFRDLVAGIN